MKSKAAWKPTEKNRSPSALSGQSNLNAVVLDVFEAPFAGLKFHWHTHRVSGRRVLPPPPSIMLPDRTRLLKPTAPSPRYLKERAGNRHHLSLERCELNRGT